MRSHFELLEKGSLADWLRGPEGMPSARAPPLSPLARVDIALDAAVGLAYLHGLRVGTGDAAAAAPQHQQPVLHRDVKFANIEVYPGGRR